jgi:energy-coupling factor transporter ATP-binding protein EcfA2
MSSHSLEISSLEERLHADSGEVILLTGAVGSGKSLWMQRMAGLVEPPATMEITIDGVACSTSSHPPTIRMLFDRWPPVWLGQYVGEELAFGLSTRPSITSLTNVLEKWGIADLALDTDLQAVNRLQAIRLSLAAMDLATPALVLLDNPTAALPQDDASALCDDIASWAEQSDTIVVVACNRWHDWQYRAKHIWHSNTPDELPRSGGQGLT